MRLSDLSPTEAANVSALLDEALELAPLEQATWLRELERREPRLHSLVADLVTALPAYAGPSEALPRLEATDLVARAITRVGIENDSLAGQYFGPYRVLRLLGQGGMGSVWLAERADGLFERQVALKVLHPNSLAASRTHFARECRILGALEHPLIARLLDAGLAPNGQPYLAIEYVEGTSLLSYADSQCLNLRARLGLMVQVLAAVQHAHQNLIVHRDLKPDNILVTPEGRIRLLDFGIAQLLTDEHANSDLTAQGLRALTPNYASPEQIAGRGVSTASDVYSLGILLYSLLCGVRPYHLQGSSQAALEAQIKVSQPLHPSDHTPSTAIAQARSTTPAKLTQALSGDLDTIVLKAIKKDPAERYPTASALLEDLHRYLAGQPILARPDSLTYRLARFVGRNKWRVALGASIGLALVTATSISIWQRQLARAQETLARQEAQRAKVVEEFLLKIFKTNSVLQPDPMRARQTTARELLDVGAQLAAESLAGAPEAQQEVLETLSDMYFQLGMYPEAARMRRQRIQSLQQVYGARDTRVASALVDFADDISNSLQREQALPALSEALQILDGNADDSSRVRGFSLIVAAEQYQYFSIPRMRGYADRASQHFRRHPAIWSDAARADRNAGRARFFAGEFQLAEPYLVRALAESEHFAPDSEWLITPLVHLAEFEFAALKITEAEKHFRRAWDISRRLRGELSGITLQTQGKLGGFLHSTGQQREGATLLEAAYQNISQEKANFTPNAMAAIHHFRGLAQFAEGRLSDALQSFSAEVQQLRSYSPNDLPLARALVLESAALTALGRYELSEQRLSEAERLWQVGSGNAVHPAAHNIYLLERAHLAFAQENFAGAESALRRVHAPSGTPALALEETQAKLVLAAIRLQQGQAEAAQALAENALRHIQSSPLRAHFQRLEAEAAFRLGEVKLHTAELSTARSLFEQAQELRAKTENVLSPSLLEVRIALAECLLLEHQASAAMAVLDQVRSALANQAELGEALKTRFQRVSALAPR